MYRHYGKRFFDCSLIIMLSPIWITLMLLIALTLILAGYPVLFKHKREGLHQVPFQFYKFTTMRSFDDKIDDSPHSTSRITKIGKVLRALSLDELPQLIHVLQGKMSLVGPRALPVEYSDSYTERQKLRFSVRPGITGLAQVKGRNSLSWEEKFDYDLTYIENISLKTDLKLISMTFTVLLASDQNASNDIVMPPFQGTKENY